MSAPLANGQKAYLAQLATRAFNRAAALARGRGEVAAPPANGEIIPISRQIETWRHEQVALATGKAGLRCCSQDDYKRIEAHFLELLGDHGKAFKAHVRAETEERRVIEWKIVAACQEFGFNLSYADKICRAQNRGAGLDDVDEKKLWNIFFTIRNRGRKRMMKAGIEEAAI